MLKTVAFLVDRLQIPQKSGRIYPPCLLSHSGSAANIEQTDHNYAALSQQVRHIRKDFYPLPKVRIFAGKGREVER